MALLPARFLFVFTLLLHCFIWSRGRYGQPLDASVVGGVELSLVKRITYELTHTEELTTYGGKEKQCRPLTIPTTSQCKHVEKDCPTSTTFLNIDYLHHYYCTDPALRPLIFSGLIIWLIFLFSTLGISASDFFTPNLATIAQLLGLDENVAGVTFLAFGNGSPDVFSTFSAMRADSGGLAIGELVGAASFIVSCVVGSMCIIRPFRVHPKPFLRDVGFFTVAVSLMLFILWDGFIYPLEAALLILLYLTYVVIVVVGSWWDRRQERKLAMEALIRSEYRDEEPLFERYADESPRHGDTLAIIAPTPTRIRAVSAPTPPRLQTDLPPPTHYSRTPSPVSSLHPAQLPSFSLIGALEFRDVVASLQRQATASSLGMFDTPITPYAGGHYHSHHPSLRRTPRNPQSSQDEETLNGLPLDERPHLISPVSTEAIHEEPHRLHPNDTDYFSSSIHTSVPSIYRTPASPTASGAESEVQLFAPLTRKQRVLNALSKLYHTLFPTLQHLKDQSVLGQIACVFAAPAVSLLTLTLPVVVTPFDDNHAAFEKAHIADGRLIDFEEEGVERVLIAEDEVEENLHQLSYSKWLMAAQCIFGPLFCVEVLFGTAKQEVGLVIATLIGGIAAATLVAVFGGNGDHPTAKMARCSMGFFVSIVWIMAIADEVVNVLQAFGIIFGLSDAIIGLTIFAVGNSLADLVANMSVAVFAPIMGFSACFGGPMLNILLGVGISGTYIMQQSSKPYDLQLSTTLLVSSVGLLVLLAATLIYVPLNDYRLTRRWGVFLILAYTTVMVVNVVVELRS